MSDPRPPLRRNLLTALAETRVQLTLMVLGALLLSWPIIHIAGDRGVISFFKYIMVIWLLLILMLFVIGRAISREDLPAENTPEDSISSDSKDVR